MTRTIPLSAALLALAACAHHPAAEPAPAAPQPTPTRAATPAAPAAGAPQQPDTASDAENALVGDWRWSGDVNTQPANGTWSMSMANGRWTGVLIMGSYPAAPLMGMNVTGRDFSFSANVVNQVWRFRCHLETRNTASCIVESLNSSGQVTATKS